MRILIYYERGQWRFCTEKVRCIQRGQEVEQYVGQEGKQWWLDFAAKWDHTEIIEFVPVEAAGEQIERLEEINQLRIPDGFGGMLSDYVKDGVFPKGFKHPLRGLQIQKEQLQQDEYLVDLDFRQSLAELGV